MLCDEMKYLTERIEAAYEARKATLSVLKERN
jgi:hypothetical protein